MTPFAKTLHNELTDLGISKAPEITMDTRLHVDGSLLLHVGQHVSVNLQGDAILACPRTTHSQF